MNKITKNAQHWISNKLFRGFLWAINQLPYDQRLHLSGLVASRIISPLTGTRRRIRNNLALVMPELPKAKSQQIVRGVPYHMGRTLIEFYSPIEFSKRIHKLKFSGAGLAAIEQAQSEGRGVMLITGHIGNYEAINAAFVGKGYQIGGLYKRMSNPYFNEHYVAAMAAIGEPLFERSRRGMAAMVRYLRSGGMVGLILDQRMNDAPVLKFMGKPARTAVSAAEMALKYNSLIVPCYAIRDAQGAFEISIEEPLEHTTPEIMTQKLNDSLEAQVRANPEQWMWTHNRWKNAGNQTLDD
ncbi:lysophospholipid acyltransferase family protein [Pseudopelagicola sp. nBUS_20]|uniref:lysophospholipid acyltransferase family protein n=1 Tax=Pseudopelagicola sp. nBUS_20 TaxID=3395317 RepID=UPI003EBF133B